jgi:hypothetical protein
MDLETVGYDNLPLLPSIKGPAKILAQLETISTLWADEFRECPFYQGQIIFSRTLHGKTAEYGKK